MLISTQAYNMPDDEKRETRSMSRRDFLKFSSAVLGGVVITGLGVDKYLKLFEPAQSESLGDILGEIKSKYGIYIPSLPGEYTKYENGEEKSTQITQDEAETIKNSLKAVPSIGRFAQLIIPFRNESVGAIAGGSYLGPNWDFFLDPSKYDNYPKDKYLSNISAVELSLPDKKLNEQIPPVTQDSNFLPPLSKASMNEAGIKAKSAVYYPWTTHGERLRQVVVHEIGGHGITQLAGRIKVNYNALAEYKASAMSMYGGIPLDTNNPIVSSFAKVNGWMLIPYSEFMAQWGDLGVQNSEQLKVVSPKMAAWGVWDRDPKYWGSLEDRTVRLDPYATYGTIKETFAQFFMFYTLSRIDGRYDKSLLTRGEIQYFDRMFNGLHRDPEKYIQNLIEENPGPSFNEDLFRTKTNPQTFNQIMWLKYPHEIRGVVSL